MEWFGVLGREILGTQTNCELRTKTRILDFGQFHTEHIIKGVHFSCLLPWVPPYLALVLLRRDVLRRFELGTLCHPTSHAYFGPVICLGFRLLPMIEGAPCPIRDLTSFSLDFLSVWQRHCPLYLAQSRSSHPHRLLLVLYWPLHLPPGLKSNQRVKVVDWLVPMQLNILQCWIRM